MPEITDSQNWSLILLSDFQCEPSPEQLAEVFEPNQIAGYQKLSAIHPKFAADSIRACNPNLVAALDMAIINQFHPYSAEDVVRRLFFFRSQHAGIERMSNSDAIAFYQNYAVGIQHVSDILLTMGLWT